MSRICTICSHKDRQRIDAQLLEGVPNTTIAANTGVSEQAVRRHAKSHLPRFEVEAATASRETDHHQKLARLERVLYTVLLARLKDEDHGMVLRTHAALLRNMEFELQLSDLQEVKREIEDLRREIEHREMER